MTSKYTNMIKSGSVDIFCGKSPGYKGNYLLDQNTL